MGRSRICTDGGKTTTSFHPIMEGLFSVLVSGDGVIRLMSASMGGEKDCLGRHFVERESDESS